MFDLGDLYEMPCSEMLKLYLLIQQDYNLSLTAPNNIVPNGAGGYYTETQLHNMMMQVYAMMMRKKCQGIPSLSGGGMGASSGGAVTAIGVTPSGSGVATITSQHGTTPLPVAGSNSSHGGFGLGIPDFSHILTDVQGWIHPHNTQAVPSPSIRNYNQSEPPVFSNLEGHSRRGNTTQNFPIYSPPEKRRNFLDWALGAFKK